MKIMLIQSLGYFIAYSGACKANKFLIEGLAGLGHECKVITVAPNDNGLSDKELFLSKLANKEVIQLHSDSVSDIFFSNGVEIHSIVDVQKLEEYIHTHVGQFEPDWVLVTEDRVPDVLKIALDASPGRVVEIAHSQVALPFGPESYLENSEHTELLKKTAGVIASSEYLSKYIEKWGDFESTLFQFPVHGTGPFNHYKNYDQGFITMVNPSEIKGLPIFLELAKRFPELQFAAVPTWATTEHNIRTLESLPNMVLLPRVDDIDEIIKKTKVLIVPSLWGEAFGAIIVDGMLRGIPVIASNVGGTSEAKLGIDYLIPVEQITEYEIKVDQRLIPIPVIPKQDMQPWFAALERLTSDREHYEQLSALSKKTADAYVANIDLKSFESYLLALEAEGVQREQSTI